MGLAALETKLSFLDSIDDDAVSFFLPFVVLFFVFSLITLPRTLYMFPIALIWHVFATFWVCNYGATLCYYFYYYYDIVLILHTPPFFFHCILMKALYNILSCDIVT